MTPDPAGLAVRSDPARPGLAIGPGWYADPAGSRRTYRWWDGAGWTRWLTRDQTSPPPGRPPDAPAPDHAPPAALPPVTDPPATDPPATDPPATDPPVPPVSSVSSETVRLPVAVGITVAAVLLALVAVGGVVTLSNQRLPSGPAIDPPPPAPLVPTITYNPSSRLTSIEEMSFTAPAPPFTCADGPRAVPGLFTSAEECTAVVHEDYNTARNDWAASVGLGVLDEDVVVADDLGATAGRVLSGLGTAYYTSVPVEVEKRELQRLTGVAPDGRGVLLTLELHYDIADVPSRYDRVVVAVFELQSGAHVCWFAMRPNDTAKSTTDVLNASVDTVEANP